MSGDIRVHLICTWTVDQLKAFLQERQIPLTGNKAELADIMYDSLKEEIGTTTFQSVTYTVLPGFEHFPIDGWTGDNFPLVTDSKVTGKVATPRIFELVFMLVWPLI